MIDKNNIINKAYKFTRELGKTSNLIKGEKTLNREKEKRELKNRVISIYNLTENVKLIFNSINKNKINIVIIYIIFYFNNYLLFRNKEIKLRKLNSDYSEIIITIAEKGEKKIIYDTIPLPDEILINEVPIPPNTTQINLEKNENIIKIRWYTKLLSCAKMFHNFDYITKVDLSNFDSSQVNDTSSMFYKCSKLEYINFTNFNTSLVTDMS